MENESPICVSLNPTDTIRVSIEVDAAGRSVINEKQTKAKRKTLLIQTGSCL
jgi:hypothetical protein